MCVQTTLVHLTHRLLKRWAGVALTDTWDHPATGSLNQTTRAGLLSDLNIQWFLFSLEPRELLAADEEMSTNFIVTKTFLTLNPAAAWIRLW